MLALHDWGNCAGQKAWVGLGVAIRYAQVFGLQFQEHMNANSPNQSFVEHETKRRTFWGLFVLDRYLSSGKYRPQMFQIDDIEIQLPSSERSFLFNERVRTNTLSRGLSQHGTRKGSGSHQVSLPPIDDGSSRQKSSTEDDGQPARWEVGPNEGVLSRYIKAIDLYGEIIRWSCSGGRR